MTSIKLEFRGKSYSFWIVELRFKQKQSAWQLVISLGWMGGWMHGSVHDSQKLAEVNNALSVLIIINGVVRKRAFCVAFANKLTAAFLD